MNENRHAYLIMAHNKFEQLGYLISLLDDARNDIYIFVDKKATFNEIDKKNLQNKVTKSNLYFTERVNVYWGSYSIVLATLILFETSYSKEKYSYYHLLSGLDLPLASQDKIHSFFKENPNKIFINIISKDIYFKNKIYRRIKYKHLLPNISDKSFSNSILKFLIRKYRRCEEIFQYVFRIDFIKKYKLPHSYSSNWATLDSETVKIFIEQKKEIEKIFKNMFIPDESFLQIVILKNNLENKIYNNSYWNGTAKEKQGNLRYINWWDGSPHIWTDSNKDIEQLKYAIKTGHLFSRKFDIDKYPKIKEYIDSNM